MQDNDYDPAAYTNELINQIDSEDAAVPPLHRQDAKDGLSDRAEDSDDIRRKARALRSPIRKRSNPSSSSKPMKKTPETHSNMDLTDYILYP